MHCTPRCVEASKPVASASLLHAAPRSHQPHAKIKHALLAYNARNACRKSFTSSQAKDRFVLHWVLNLMAALAPSTRQSQAQLPRQTDDVHDPVGTRSPANWGHGHWASIVQYRVQSIRYRAYRLSHFVRSKALQK